MTFTVITQKSHGPKQCQSLFATHCTFITPCHLFPFLLISFFFILYVACMFCVSFLFMWSSIVCSSLTFITHSHTPQHTTQHTTRKQTTNKQTNTKAWKRAINQNSKRWGGATLAPVCSLSHTSKLHKLTMPLNAQNQIGKRNITQTPHTITSVTNKPTNQRNNSAIYDKRGLHAQTRLIPLMYTCFFVQSSCFHFFSFHFCAKDWGVCEWGD